MKPVVLSLSQWTILRNQIIDDYPASVMLIKERMKSTLGFTVRQHSEWIDGPDPKYTHNSYAYESPPTQHYHEDIRLDFWDERKRTMFLLKYGEFLVDQNCRT